MASGSDSEPPAKRAREEDNITSLKAMLHAGSGRTILVEEGTLGGRKKSKVWGDFHRVNLDGEGTNFVACRRCRDLIRHVPGHTGTGTSSMQRHTDAHLKNVAGQQSLTSFFGKKGLEGQKNVQKRKLARAIATFCALDMRPLSVAEGEGYKVQAQAFVQVGAALGAVQLEKEGLVPSRSTVTGELQTMADVKEALKTELDKQPSVSFTTDHWTDKVTGCEYQSATAAYVDENWQLKTRVLKIEAAEEAHTAVNINGKMTTIIEDFGFSGRCRFVTDNAAAMKAAFRQHDWTGCTCHQLNLVVQDTLKLDEDVLPLKKMSEASKTLIRWMKKSNTNRTLAKRLRQSIVTRWNSELAMFQSVLNAYGSIQLLEDFTEVARFLGVVAQQDLEDLVSTLRFFKTATDTLEGEGVTAFLVPVVRERAERELAPATTDRPFARRMKEHLLGGMRRKFVVTDGHLLAAMLHPRYRSLRQFSFITDQKRTDIRQLLVEEVVSATASPGELEIPEQQPGTDDQALDLIDIGLDMELEDLDDLPAAPVAPSREVAMSVVDRYLVTPPASTVKNILDFWRTDGQQFNGLPKVARFAHGLPASSASSERLFSAAGRTMDPRRSALSPDHLDQLLLVKGNRDLLKH